jgi:hypothetical protein
MAYIVCGLYNTDSYMRPVNLGAIGRQTLSATEAAAVDTDYILDGATTSTAATTIVTFAHQPPYCRTLTVVAADGTSAHVKANSTCTITGTNIADETISDVLTFDENQSTAEETVKAFKSVAKIVFSAMDGAAKFDVGYGEKIGIPFMLSATAADRPMVEVTLDGVIETTAPTITADADELEKNLIDLNSDLNGKEVCIYYWV